jgi:hypothetical protein
MDTWKHFNQRLTKTVVGKINSLPAPIKVAVGFLPGGGAATSYADVHRWTIVKAAQSLQKKGKLSKEAGNALRNYSSALSSEQRTYSRLLQVLEKEFDKKF